MTADPRGPPDVAERNRLAPGRARDGSTLTARREGRRPAYRRRARNSPTGYGRRGCTRCHPSGSGCDRLARRASRSRDRRHARRQPLRSHHAGSTLPCTLERGRGVGAGHGGLWLIHGHEGGHDPTNATTPGVTSLPPAPSTFKVGDVIAQEKWTIAVTGVTDPFVSIDPSTCKVATRIPPLICAATPQPVRCVPCAQHPGGEQGKDRPELPGLHVGNQEPGR